jgi:hypothetical protein
MMAGFMDLVSGSPALLLRDKGTEFSENEYDSAGNFDLMKTGIPGLRYRWVFAQRI